MTEPSFPDVVAAAARIAPYAVRTPLLRNAALDQRVGARLYFKCENLQRVGAFKFRGACNAVFSLRDDEAARGIVTQSSGNHGAAIALAATLRGVPAHVVVPHDAPRIKLANIRGYGATVHLCEPGMAARDAAAARVLAETGGALVHPFNDARVIAGQGTATYEMLQQVEVLDAVIAPVSGGGLLSGTAIAAHGLAPGLRVFGAEPAQAADTHASFERGARVTDMTANTICDGLRATVGELTFPILQRHVEAILLADETEIVAAMRLVFEHLKLVIEPSAAVPLAALIRARDRVAGLRIGVILSGGNVDLDRLPFGGPAP